MDKTALKKMWQGPTDPINKLMGNFGMQYLDYGNSNPFILPNPCNKNILCIEY